MALPGTKRFFIGGLGGLAPVFALLLAVDLEKNLVGTNTLQVAGYGLRVMALFAIGGFIAWLHDSEDKPFKLFEIGVGAPALLAGLITTKSILPDQQPREAGRNTSAVPELLFLAGRAHAQDPPRQPLPVEPVKAFSLPRAEGADAFWQGLLGAQPKNVYYVIAGSHLKYEDARKQADDVNARFPQFKAEVYAPYGGNLYYGVVIGALLPRADAKAVQTDAVRAGLPKDTYLWTLPALR